MIFDLTHPLNNGMPVYPGTTHPTFQQSNFIEKDGFSELTITMCTHTGTHMDAPAHILPQTKTLDQFSMDKFIGKGLLIDVRSEETINIDFLKSFENEISFAEFVIFHTGWSKKWGTPRYFDGFPTLTQKASEWLTQFKLKAIGFDAISADKVTESNLPNHHLFLEREILIVENLTHLDKLPGKNFEFHCIPLNITNTDGSPIRAFARYP